MKVLIMNGAPRSGKDTMVDEIARKLKGKKDVIYFSVKHILCLGVAKRYGVSPLHVWKLNSDSLTKDDPSDIFEGKSVREALIYESEDVIKVEHGEQGVIELATNDLINVYGDKLNDAVIVCPDGGFNSEIPVIRKNLNIPRDDLFITRILRKGCSFKGDSREYIKNPNKIIWNIQLEDYLKQSNAIIHEAEIDSQITATGLEYTHLHPAFK